MKKNNLTAVLGFIIFKKACDSIHRGVIVKILRVYGVPPRAGLAAKKLQGICSSSPPPQRPTPARAHARFARTAHIAVYRRACARTALIIDQYGLHLIFISMSDSSIQLPCIINLHWQTKISARITHFGQNCYL